MSRTLRIATRGSRLAVWQAEHTRALILEQEPDREVELVPISTEGDRNQSDALVGFGGVGVFTREIQKAVLDGRADIAVHSLKDLPTETDPRLSLAGIPRRAPRCDAMILPQGAATIEAISDLPEKARIATGSPRRRSQLAAVRSDFEFCDVRGNVETRIAKLDAGEFDALVLAEAGLERLGLDDRISLRLTPPEVFPAVGQASLGIECRADDRETIDLLRAISHAATVTEVTAERAALAELRAGCHAPVGVWTEVRGDEVRLQLVVLSNDGRERYEHVTGGPVEEADSLGREAARQVIEAGASSVLGS